MQHLSRLAQLWARSLLLRHSSSQTTTFPPGKPGSKNSNSFKRFFNRAVYERAICSSSISLLPKGRATEITGDGGNGKDEDDEDEDGKSRRKGKKQRPEINKEDIASEPMDYFFAGVAPDFKAPRLSDESKEKMWKAFAGNPVPEMIDTLAETYKIRKQRVHAILWLKDIEKKEAAERGKPLADDIEKNFEQIHGAYDKAENERHYTLPSTRPDFVVQPEGWQGAVKAEGQSIDEASAKEEKMMVEEFEQRMVFNKLQIAGFIKTNRLSRQRPPEGWSYLVEELGADGKRGRRGGRRYVAQPDGTHRGLNELEKLFLKRETVRPRRRLTPK